MYLFDKVLIAKQDVGFKNLGRPINANVIKFFCTDLPYSTGTYQWVVKLNQTDADNASKSSGAGVLTANKIDHEIVLNVNDYAVGETYYYALRVFNGSGDSQEVIQIAFTIAQNAVLAEGQSQSNTSPLYIGGFSTADRDSIVSDKALFIYNTDEFEIQFYSPDSDSWQALVGVSYLKPNNNLSDLENATQARENLDVYSKAESEALSVSSYAQMYLDQDDTTTTGTGLTSMANGYGNYTVLNANSQAIVSSEFTHTAGNTSNPSTLQYNGSESKRFLVTAEVGFTSSSTLPEYAFAVTKNGSKQNNIKNSAKGANQKATVSLNGIITLNQGDIISIGASSNGGGGTDAIRLWNLLMTLVEI